jgi:hypothetical protein
MKVGHSNEKQRVCTSIDEEGEVQEFHVMNLESFYIAMD